MAANKKIKVASKAKSKKPKVKVAAKKVAAKKAAPKKASVKKNASKKPATKKTALKKPATKKNLSIKKTATSLKKAKAHVLASTKAKTKENYAKVFSPLDDRILVDTLPSETVTPGGLIIPDSAQEKQSRGVVVAVGPGRRNKKAKLRPLDVQLGDQIIYAKHSGTAIEILGKEVLIIREEDVLGIVNK